MGKTSLVQQQHLHKQHVRDLCGVLSGDLGRRLPILSTEWTIADRCRASPLCCATLLARRAGVVQCELDVDRALWHAAPLTPHRPATEAYRRVERANRTSLRPRVLSLCREGCWGQERKSKWMNSSWQQALGYLAQAATCTKLQHG